MLHLLTSFGIDALGSESIGESRDPRLDGPDNSTFGPCRLQLRLARQEPQRRFSGFGVSVVSDDDELLVAEIGAAFVGRQVVKSVRRKEERIDGLDSHAVNNESKLRE